MTQQNVNVPPDSPAATHKGPGIIFIAFSQLALNGFGGVLPVAYRILVERRKWLTPVEFAELIALSQVLPGATICNLSVMVGHRFAGLKGAAAALAGLIVLPFILISILGFLYQSYGEVQLVRQALTGMSVVAAGLIISVGLKMVRVLPRLWMPMGFAALAFVSVGLLRWPLAAVLGILGVLSVGLAWRSQP